MNRREKYLDEIRKREELFQGDADLD